MKRFLPALAVFSLLFFCGVVYAQNKLTEYRAIFSERTPDGAETTGKIYVAHDKSRYEVDGSGEIVVSRYDKKVTWFIYPRLRRYVEEPNTGAQTLDPAEPAEGTFGDLTRKFEGFDSRDSYRMKKYSVRVELPGKGDLADEYFEWYRDGFPYPVRTATSGDAYVYELSKIQIGPMDPDLFAEPKRYKKVTMEELDMAHAEKDN